MYTRQLIECHGFWVEEYGYEEDIPDDIPDEIPDEINQETEKDEDDDWF